MDSSLSYESSNINAQWLKNIFENLKNLESLERTAREGCITLLDYLNIPMSEWKIKEGDSMYKNLKFMLTEIKLLITDLTPVLDKEVLESFNTKVESLDRLLKIDKLFVNRVFSLNGSSIIATKVTPYFYETLDAVSILKREIISKIAHILYMKNESKVGKPWE